MNHVHIIQTMHSITIFNKKFTFPALKANAKSFRAKKRNDDL